MQTKYIFFLLLAGLISPLLSVAQTATYRSYFGNEFTHWYAFNFMIDAGNWSELYSVFNQDTLLSNGVNYKKVYRFFSLDPIQMPLNEYYYFGIREEIETGSLYISDDISEMLVSRMDLEVGDKYYFPRVSPYFNHPHCWHCFQGGQTDENGNYAIVDSIYYKDNRKYIRFDVNYHALLYDIPLTFIEGIGPNVSFVPLLNEFSMAVCCKCYEDETGVWKYIDNRYLADFIESEDCFWDRSLSLSKIDHDFPLKLIQRKGEIELQPDAGEFISGGVYVYSMQGELLYVQPAKGSTNIVIPTSGFSNGTYIVRLTEEKTKKTWSRKVIIG